MSAPLRLGDRVRFSTPTAERRLWWDVRAADARWAVLTRQAQFQPKGDLVYTIVDHESARRGPCNRIGQGWDVAGPGGCDELLTELQAGRVQISHRNNIAAEIRDHRPADPSTDLAFIEEG